MGITIEIEVERTHLPCQQVSLDGLQHRVPVRWQIDRALHDDFSLWTNYRISADGLLQAEQFVEVQPPPEGWPLEPLPDEQGGMHELLNRLKARRNSRRHEPRPEPCGWNTIDWTGVLRLHALHQDHRPHPQDHDSDSWWTLRFTLVLDQGRVVGRSMIGLEQEWFGPLLHWSGRLLSADELREREESTQ